MSPRMMAGVDTGRILDSSGSMAGMMLRRISWGSSCRGRAPSSSPLVASLFFATVSWVLHESEVGIVDWHTSIPLRNTFHGDLILIVATSNVFSALQRYRRISTWKSIHDNDDPTMAFGVYDHSEYVPLCSAISYARRLSQMLHCSLARVGPPSMRTTHLRAIFSTDVGPTTRSCSMT